ncbi:MAG: lipase family protein [Gammaproteobacteria bacterium]|nr:lipase family protein [Gammaproteobacteria bacterium]
MPHKHIIFVPGKNPKPAPEQHKALLWRTLLEGVHRADPDIAQSLTDNKDDFHLADWNYLYYHQYKDSSQDLPWIDALINNHGPTKQDIQQANSFHIKFDRLLFTFADYFPFIIRFLPKAIRMTATETNRYFNNEDNIACDVREKLKNILRPLLADEAEILIIGHSLGSVISYDALWELSHLEQLQGKLDLLTIGSPLGMNYVQNRVMGHSESGAKKYPTIISHWTNIASVGDITALDRAIYDDFSEMLKLGIIDTLEDHCKGIYNFFKNDQGLNCHRSYGYLVNPAVGKVIADWWKP